MHSLARPSAPGPLRPPASTRRSLGVRGRRATPGRPGSTDAVLTCRCCSAGDVQADENGRNERESLRLRRCASPAGPSRVCLALTRSVDSGSPVGPIGAARFAEYTRNHTFGPNPDVHIQIAAATLSLFDTVIWGDGCSISACACAPPAETIDAACECDAAK